MGYAVCANRNVDLNLKIEVRTQMNLIETKKEGDGLNSLPLLINWLID